MQLDTLPHPPVMGWTGEGPGDDGVSIPGVSISIEQATQNTSRLLSLVQGLEIHQMLPFWHRLLAPSTSVADVRPCDLR